MKKLPIILLFCSMSFLLNAQIGWEAGGSIGVSYYFGDLNSNYRLNRPGLSANVLGRFNFNNRLCLKFQASYGQVRAYDADSQNSYEQARNLSFRSNIFDGTAQFEFNFLPYNHGSADEFYTPYLFAGMSVFYFNPQAEIDGSWVDLRPLGTEGQFKGEEYYTVQGGIAFGGGIKISLNYEWSINVELSTRYLFSDYLDDVSTVYPDMDDLENLRGSIAVELADRSDPNIYDPKIGQQGRQRGNSNNNDTYTFLTIGLVYYFGDLRCPEFSR